MDPGGGGDAERATELAVILGTVGAMAGAASAFLVYAVCARRQHTQLNWFEKDLLARAEEAERSSKLRPPTVATLPGVVGAEGCCIDMSGVEEEWRQQQQQQPPLTPRLREAREAGRHLSECSCDETTSAGGISPLAPPLPGGGALVASDERMVILRSLPLGSSSSTNGSTDGGSCHVRLSSTDSDDISCPRSANETRGELQLSLTYDAPSGILSVKLVEARDLRARDLSETADPYAKIRLLPDRSTVKQSRIQKQTLNPEFDENFVFQVPPNCQLAERTLEVLLYDFDASSKHRGLGYVQIPMATLMGELGPEPRSITKPVLRYGGEGKFKAPPLGELMVSLSYQPAAERLTVIVIRARNLPINDETGTSTFEPYVQVNIIREGKSLKKKKTSIRREGTSPVWSESLNFDLAADVLAQCQLDFSIYRANGELLARCEVSELRQYELFHRVLAGAGASAQWLPLSEPVGDSSEQPPKSS